MVTKQFDYIPLSIVNIIYLTVFVNSCPFVFSIVTKPFNY